MKISKERENLVYTANLAKEAERYNDVVATMKKVLNLDVEIELSPEERNFLSLGYKEVVEARRLSWRALSQELKEETQGNAFCVEELKKYSKKVAEEISTMCEEIITTVDGLIPRASDAESKAHFYMMKGDCYRYLAELQVGDDERQKAIAESMEAYEKATAVARADLPPTNHIRLGVALNFSTLYRQILDIPDTAFRLVKIAFDEAVAEINGKLSQEQYLNCLSVLMQIRDFYHMKTTPPPLVRCTPSF